MSDLVPEGWSIAKIGDAILSAEGGVSVNSENRQKTNKEFGVLKTSSVVNGRFYPAEHKAILNDEVGRASTNPKKDHILFSRMNTPILVGQSGFVDKDYNDLFLPDRLWQIKVANQFHPKWLSYTLRSQDVVKHITDAATGTSNTMKNIAKPNLMAIPMRCPPLPEQQKIAAILSSVDEVIEKTQAQINKLKDLKTGMMQELLSPREGQTANINNPQGESKNGLHHTEFKDSPLGRIPVGWEVVKFESATVKIQDGTHFSPQSKAGECLYLTSKNIQNGKLDLRKISYISQKEHDGIYKRCNVQFGDVLLTKDGANTGNCAMNTLTQPFSLLSSVAFLRCDTSQCLNEFMYQYILSSKFQRIIQDSMTGNAITRLTLTIIKNMNLTLPPINEQKKIVGALSSVDRYIDEKIKKMEAIKKSKKALMQDLLTGKVRVKVD